jgi:hypothetical protein
MAEVTKPKWFVPNFLIPIRDKLVTLVHKFFDLLVAFVTFVESSLKTPRGVLKLILLFLIALEIGWIGVKGVSLCLGTIEAFFKLLVNTLKDGQWPLIIFIAIICFTIAIIKTKK